jgi:hypothetical protein
MLVTILGGRAVSMNLDIYRRQAASDSSQLCKRPSSHASKFDRFGLNRIFPDSPASAY